MHNSNNPAKSKDLFTSALLAQASLLGLSANPNNPNLQENIEADTTSKVSVLPCLFEPKVGNSKVPAEVQDCLERKFQAKQAKIEVELLAKANEFGIPYNKSSINWHELEDKICEFESLIKEADEMYIDWQDFGYDPIGIEQAIEDLSQQNFENLMVERVYGSSLAY